MRLSYLISIFLEPGFKLSLDLYVISINYVEYYDGFFHMRQMEETWKLNMTEEFNPLCINELDESMMDWFTIYAPIFMCVGRKPHPFGNERYTICCGLTSILWRAQKVEVKYHPQQLLQKE